MKADGSVAVFRMKAAIEVYCDRAIILRACFHAFPVKGNPPGENPADQVYSVHVMAEYIDHLCDYDPRFGIFVWPWKNLAVTQAVAGRYGIL